MKHPFQCIAVDQQGLHLFTTAKNIVQVFDLQNGETIGSWEDDRDHEYVLKKQQLDRLMAKEKSKDAEGIEGPDIKKIKLPKIPSPGVGAPQIYNKVVNLQIIGNQLFAIADSDKSVLIFSIDYTLLNCLKLIKRQCFPKRPNAFAVKDNVVFVADKFGDMYTFNIDAEAVDEKTLQPTLGHVSLLTDVIITTHDDKNYVVTADRDEHIRVTNYPQTYEIKGWLFGHDEFISKLCICDSNQDILISGGGDDEIYVWNWFEEKLLSKTNIRELVESYLTDDHLPPDRYRNEQSERELCISWMESFSTKTSSLLLVNVENTRAILLFKVDDFKAHWIQTFELDSSIIDLTLDSKGCMYAAVESSDFLKSLQIKDDKIELLHVSSDIPKNSLCDVGDKKDFYPFYNLNWLRKRSEH